MDLITEFDSWQQLCAVVNLLNSEHHCTREAKLTGVDAAHKHLCHYSNLQMI